MPLAVAAVYFNGLTLAALVAVFTFLGLWEYVRISFKSDNGTVIRFTVMCVASAAFIIEAFLQTDGIFKPTLFALLVLTGVYELAAGRIEGSLSRLSKMSFGVLYIGWSLSNLMLLRNLDGNVGFYAVLYVLVVTWATDSSAFFVGRRLGKHPLCKVSPKKSVEGAVGGIVGGIAFGFLFRSYLNLDLYQVFLLSLGTSLVSEVGDLIESLLKRDAGIKDSGHLLPGHGGILDRIDSVLFSLPFVYYCMVRFL
jgi:phosphatidate cytidylyltransferase